MRLVRLASLSFVLLLLLIQRNETKRTKARGDDADVVANAIDATTNAGNNAFGRSAQFMATDVLHFGIGLGNGTSQSLMVSTIPTDAVVRAAFVYWTPVEAVNTLLLDSASIVGTQIGALAGDCYETLFAYRADVTSELRAKRNGVYEVDVTVDADGAALFIVYDDPNVATRKTITFFDGLIQKLSGSTLTATLATADLVDLDALIIEIGGG